jgi:CDP-glycerol glycerophosphotransferase
MKLPRINRQITDALVAFRQFLTAILAWILGYPLTWLIRRDPNLIVVIARPGFSDNSKYFFLYASEQHVGYGRVVLLTGDHEILRQVISAGGEATLHPSWQSLLLLLRCGTMATDVSAWFNYGGFPLTQGANRVQMWHGAPLKHIELALFKQRLMKMPAWSRPLLLLQKAVIGRYPRYDLVVATSTVFINAAFAQSFRSRAFVATGYPRNDILFGWPAPRTLAHRLARINVDEEVLLAVKSAKQSGSMVCLFVPTFRKDMGCSFDNAVDLERLSAFAGRHRFLIILKLHPFLQGMHRLQDYPHLIEYAPQGDVYPLMPLIDILITDYSSIYFDYLLLDRPLVFLTHDLENYLSHDRAMYFDFEQMTPGAQCHNQEDLEQALLAIKSGKGASEQQVLRERVRAFTHDWLDGQATSRLLEYCNNISRRSA